MKKIIFLFFLSFNLLGAESCPKLEGSYHCNFSDGKYSKLQVTQEDGSTGITLYGFEYLAIGGGVDIVPASISGEPDSFG